MAENLQTPGLQYFCRLIIKGQEYVPQNIISLTIREWVFNILPTIELVIYDDGFLTEASPLEDNDDIYVELSKNEDDENPIELYFNLSDYKISLIADNRKFAVELTGYLKVSNIFQIKNRSFKNKNSLNVLSTIASELDLNLTNPQLINPSDNMTWYQINQNNLDFVKHVLKRSKVINDVVFFYANTNKEFVYTSLNKELIKIDTKIAKFDVTNYMNYNQFDETVWYNYYDIVNYAGYYNRMYSYGTKYSYYDLTRNIEKEYNTTNSLTQLTFKDSEYFNKPVVKKVNGSFNRRNIYVDYFESIVRNKYLVQDFFAYSLVLNINALSKIKLFDKINLAIPSQIEDGEIAENMSGEYLVGGIIHHISQGGTYQKSISLHRNGMDKSVYMKTFRVQNA